MATAAATPSPCPCSPSQCIKFRTPHRPYSQFSRSSPHRSCRRCHVICCAGSSPRFVAGDLKFVLHDALDLSGVDTTLAREARKEFRSQIGNLSVIERETSISINRGVDLGKTALYIAAEDDSLVSHSSVPLPVEAFIQRLDDLSMGYCSHYNSRFKSSPQTFLDSLDKYLYSRKRFHRSSPRSLLDFRSLYLHSVLTHRSGSAAMLSLIYSESLKMLRLAGLLNFDVEIFFPHDLEGLPRGYDKQKSTDSDQSHIMTSQALLVQILTDLKGAFWPFQHNHNESLFLRAAQAANCSDRSNASEERYGFQLASTKAAQYRLDRGVWTTVRLGDMRRALAACERLILLEFDLKELRDYSILLYHCGLYEQSLEYLKLYMETKISSLKGIPSDPSSIMEDDAEEKLMVRLNLILMEDGWGSPTHARNFLSNNSEPW
ncbi:Transglut_core2 domain-containing protein [Psidium guajava]|nr:Transglut_core2 domain-containing protein [Psidium guajava]